MKINQKLLAGFLAVVLLVGVVGYVGYQTATEILTSEIESRFTHETRNVMNMISIVMHGRYHDIKAFSESDVLRRETSTTEEITSCLQRKKEGFGYESLSYFDMNRIRIADTEGVGIGKQHPLEGFWHEVLEGKISAGSDVRHGPEREIPIIYFAAPVRNQEEEIIGVVVARFEPKQLQTILESATSATDLLYHTTLIDKDGDIILATCLFYEDKTLEKIPEDLLSVREVLSGRDGMVEEYMPHHKGYFVSIYVHEKRYRDFEGNNWSLIFSVSKDKALAPVTSLGKTTLILTLTALLLAIGFGVFIYHSISKPIADLRNVAAEIGRGNLDAKIEIKSKDEIGDLAASVSRMTQDLKESIEVNQAAAVATAAREATENIMAFARCE